MERGREGWTGARGGAGGLSTTEIRKEDFQSGDSKGLPAEGDLDKLGFSPFLHDIQVSCLTNRSA